MFSEPYYKKDVAGDIEKNEKGSVRVWHKRWTFPKQKLNLLKEDSDPIPHSILLRSESQLHMLQRDSLLVFTGAEKISIIARPDTDWRNIFL